MAQDCRDGLRALGVRLWPAREEYCFPTVTAAVVPEGWTWPGLDRALRAKGWAVGGSYGPLAGKVFRVGHMGSQADHGVVARGLGVLDAALRRVIR